MATKAITYALGRNCILRVDDRELTGVADVVLRQSCTTVDATGYGTNAPAAAVVLRSYDLGFTVPDLDTARWLFERRFHSVNGFLLPQVLRVEFEGGLFDFWTYFTIHEVDADEPIDGAVIPRFQLREWRTDVERA